MKTIIKVIILAILIYTPSISIAIDDEVKVALVTGASGGIGQEITKSLCSNGFFVIAQYYQDRKGAEQLSNEVGNDKIFLISVDLSNPKNVMKLWVKGTKWKGHVDVVINNAGVLRYMDLTDQNDKWEEIWNESYQVNLLAPAILCREAIKDLKQNNKQGIIINIASQDAFTGLPPAIHYATAKSGLINLTKSIAEQHAKDNIYAYAIAPEFVDTKMIHNYLDQKATESLLENLIPIKKLVPPQEIANLVVFLAQGKLLHATGSTINVTGAAHCR